MSKPQIQKHDPVISHTVIYQDFLLDKWNSGLISAKSVSIAAN